MCDLYDRKDNVILKERIVLGEQYRIVDLFREDEIEVCLMESNSFVMELLKKKLILKNKSLEDKSLI